MMERKLSTAAQVARDSVQLSFSPLIHVTGGNGEIYTHVL